MTFAWLLLIDTFHDIQTYSESANRPSYNKWGQILGILMSDRESLVSCAEQAHYHLGRCLQGYSFKKLYEEITCSSYRVLCLYFLCGTHKEILMEIHEVQSNSITQESNS